MTQPSETSDLSPEDWERIARYLTGEADAVEAENTRRWTEEDPARLSIVQASQTAIRGIRVAGADDIDVEAALRNVKHRAEASKVISISSRAKPAPARGFTVYMRAAAAILIFFGGLALWRSVTAKPESWIAQRYSTGMGERRQFILADGSRVTLGPLSTLETFSIHPNERSVGLRGDGYFNVIHDSGRPFVVRAGNAIIRDIGTAFSVQSDDGGLVRVAVDSGTVEIDPSRGNTRGGPTLKARDRAAVDVSGVVAVERAAVSEDDVAWVQGRLVFRDTPLVQVGAELYRWYGVRLRVADSSLANLHLTASFAGEPIDRVLEVIALSLGARVERQGNVAILHRAAATPARR
jgi:transmembrane sensor